MTGGPLSPAAFKQEARESVSPRAWVQLRGMRRGNAVPGSDHLLALVFCFDRGDQEDRPPFFARSFSSAVYSRA